MGCGEEKKRKKNPCRYRASILLGKDLLNEISKQHGMPDGDKCKGDNRKAVKGHTGSWWTVLLDLVTRKNLTENVTFEQRPEGGKAAENVVIWEKSIPSTGNSKCKGPVVGARLVPGRARVTEVE